MENSNPSTPAALTPDAELTLIQRYQSGDEGALQELVLKFDAVAQASRRPILNSRP